MTNNITQSFIILDKAKCHETPLFRNALKEINNNSQCIFIPASLTGKYFDKFLDALIGFLGIDFSH